MPETLVCPECQRKMRLPDGVLGKKVKCPTCAAVFVATAPEAAAVPVPPPVPVPVPEPEDRDEYVSPPPRSWSSSRAEREEPEVAAAPLATGTPSEVQNEAQAWQAVQAGLKFHMAAHICDLAGIFFFLLLIIIVTTASSEPRFESDPFGGGRPMRRSGPSPGALVTLGLFATLAMVGSFLGSLVGSSFGLAAPLKYGTRSMSVACLVLAGITTLLFVQAMQGLVLAVPAFDRGRGEQGGVVVGLSVLFLILLEVARLTLLALFLRGVAACTGFRGAASSARALAILTPSAILGAMAFNLLIGLTVEPGTAVSVVLFVLFCAAWIVVLVMGLALLARSIRNIDRGLRALASE